MWPCRALSLTCTMCVAGQFLCLLMYTPSWWDFLLRDLVLSHVHGRAALSQRFQATGPAWFSPGAPHSLLPCAPAPDAGRGLLLLAPPLSLFWGLPQHIIMLAGNVGIHLPQRGCGHLLGFDSDSFILQGLDSPTCF